VANHLKTPPPPILHVNPFSVTATAPAETNPKEMVMALAGTTIKAMATVPVAMAENQPTH